MVHAEIQRRFLEFDAANPQVYEMFCRFAFAAIAAKRGRFGARMIWERMRWYTMIEAPDLHSGFKLNDHYPPYYARKFMGDHPEHAGFFEIRDKAEPPEPMQLPLW